MKRPTRQLSFVIEETVADAIQREAMQENRTISSKLRLILRGYLRQQREDSPLFQILKPVDGTCSSCAHYRPHYIKKDGFYYPAACGHCACPKTTTRKPSHASCSHWEKQKTTP